jgi:hypothetical protein
VSAAPEYCYTLDDAYLRQGGARYSTVQPARTRMLARSLPVALYLVLAGWVGWSFRAQPALDAFYVALVTFVYWHTGRKAGRKGAGRLKGSPLENAIVRVWLRPDCLEFEGASTRARFPWDSFTAARFFEDGLLLFDGPRSYRWLPNTGLSGATPVEVEARVREWVADSTRVS